MYENLITTKYGGNINIGKGSSTYACTSDLNTEKLRNLVEEFTHIAKIKGLTVRQAQQVFLVCADYVLDGEYK